MPGDTIRRYKPVTAGVAATAAASSTLIVMADYSTANQGIYAPGVIQFPANTIGTWSWYAMATPSSALAPLYNDAGTVMTVAINAAGGVYPIPKEAFGCHAITGQGAVASTFTAGMMS